MNKAQHVIQSLSELTAKQKEYREFYKGVLKKFGVKSPAQLKGSKKKEFFDYIEKNWTKDKD